MHGFICIIQLPKKIFEPIPIHWKKSLDSQSTFIHLKTSDDNYQAEQFSSEKFKNEKLWLNTENYLCITEGIIHNLTDICKNKKVADTKSLFDKYFEENDSTFFNQFEGNFAGVYYNKKNNTWTAFNNKTGTKKVYYFQNSEYMIFASDLKTLTHCLRTLHIPFSLNEDGAYLLLTSGFMHENLTLINEVKQLRAGEYCTFSDNTLSVTSYFHLKNISETNDTKTTIIEQLDVLFKEAIRLEFEIDKAHNLTPLTTLSGGLDSRMTALIAHKMGYQNQVLFNFSEKGYADEVIAKQIAKKFDLKLIQFELNAQSLTAIDEVVSANDGLTLYSSCSHAFSALKQIDHKETGILHTGMIGDAVMGSFVSKVDEVKPKIRDGLNSNGLLKRAESYLNKSMSNYPNEELYKFYNRAFLGANSGFQFYDLISESFSPFLNAGFFSYAYSIPRKYKFKENIYIEWIKTMHPDIANFTWENIGGKPTNNTLLRNYYRYKRAIIKRLPINTMWKNNMNPEQLWYDKNEEVRCTLDSYFNNHIDRLNDYKELRDDVIELYNTGNITEKTQVLTLLSAYKLHFE